eukprot:3042346-Pyramimonas_sp.AAC.1
MGLVFLISRGWGSCHYPTAPDHPCHDDDYDDEDVSSGLLVVAFLRGGRQGYCTASVRAKMAWMSRARRAFSPP